MKPLPFLERATRDHVPSDADEWDLHLYFNIEKEVIDRHLREVARANWREFNDLQKTLGAGTELVAEIGARYDKSGEIHDERIYEEAARGNLKRQSPSVGTIMTWQVAFWIAVLAETAVMLVQQAVTGDFNPFIIVLALLLALGGFLQGQGIGSLFVKGWMEETKRAQLGDQSGAHWLQFSIGSALILLVSGVRGSGADEPAQFALIFLVTLLFGEAVAICEALKVKYKAMRATLLVEMGQAQHWQANVDHHKEMTKGSYRLTYEGTVRQSEDQGAQSSQPEPPPADSGASRPARP
jgi:hypothetical protein